ncbi:MAG: dienelactone hydrolase family protein [Verrucomicrobiota bacterium]
MKNNPAPSEVFQSEVTIPLNDGSDARVSAFLNVPADARSIVAFAHGSGSSRHSSRNQFVARMLNEGGFATLLLDLLTPEEERVDIQTREHRFNIALLADRMTQAVDWLKSSSEVGDYSVGTFGASTGAAAALIAATQRPADVKAVVSRGGRPDLAGLMLAKVQAPTLLIVGSEDREVIALNEEAQSQLECRNELRLIPSATHLFSEPGTLEAAAEAARDWFAEYL